MAAIEAKAEKLGLVRLTLDSTTTAHRFYLERGYRDSGTPETGRLKASIYPMVKALSYKKYACKGLIVPRARQSLAYFRQFRHRAPASWLPVGG
jgi:hypothetical protein